MDDPWGSPWATNDSSTNLEPFPRASLSTATLEPPGRTLTRNRSFSTQSPWATDDDGFADWASADPGLTLPPTALAASPSPGWSVWGGENGVNTSQTHLSSRAREGSLGQPSPTLWPAATSPGLQPTKTVSRRSSARSLSLFRQPSPDPWSTEFSQNRLSLPAAVHNNSTDYLPFSALESHDEEPEPAATAPKTNGEPTISDSKPPEDPIDDATAHATADDSPEPGEGHTQDPSNSPTLSRHSSLSDDSHHDDRPPESPITSMDEDAKDRPVVTRRPSTKIQELVHMYDDLTKKTDQTLLTPDTAGGRLRSTSRSTSIRSSRTDDASDFGDFEDAREEGVARPSRKSSLAGSPRRPISRSGRVRSLSKTSLRKSSAATPTQPAPSPIFEEVSSKFNELRQKFGPVKFDVSLDSVDILFDVEKLNREQPSAKDYSLDAIDGIIKDSFSSVSERKTWYRVSRPGPLRKHNMGDDENYRRVTWAGSKVREEVTTVVRRWMEENSYGGRPTIGGGSAPKSGGFNWDAKSKAEPLSFDQIFGKRKSVQPLKPATTPLPRPLSLQPEPTKPGHSRNSSAGVKSLPPRSPLSIPEPPPGPAFGWSTGANCSSTPTASPRPSSQYVRPSLDMQSTRSALSRTSSMHDPESRSSLQLAPPPTAPTLMTSTEALTPSVAIIADDDEDEEWGDMVASPAVETRPNSILFDNSVNGSIASFQAPGPDTSTLALSVPFDSSVNGSMSSLHAQFAETPAQQRSLFDNSVNGSVSSLHAQFAETPPRKMGTATPVLEAVTSKLEETTRYAPSTTTGPPASSSAASVDIWDFSAFDSGPAIPSIPPTITSNPELDFDTNTPLQSPSPSISSRTSSPSSLPVSKPPMSSSSAPARAESPNNLLQHPKPPTSSVPFRPQHGQHRSKSSLNLVRPSPLHNVITPKAASPTSATADAPAAKTVSFASQEEKEEEDVLSEENSALVRQIVGQLPSLSYMLR